MGPGWWEPPEPLGRRPDVGRADTRVWNPRQGVDRTERSRCRFRYTALAIVVAVPLALGRRTRRRVAVVLAVRVGAGGTPVLLPVQLALTVSTCVGLPALARSSVHTRRGGCGARRGRADRGRPCGVRRARGCRCVVSRSGRILDVRRPVLARRPRAPDLAEHR